MNRQVEQTLKDILEEVAGCEGEFGGEAVLKEELGVDSLALVAVIAESEERFGIEFGLSDLDPAALVTFGDLVGLVTRYV